MQLRITIFLVITCAASLVQARIVSREEALQAAFPGTEIRQSMIFLTDAEKKEASQRAGVEVESALVARYDAYKDGKPVGCAYLDTHIVRTKKESLLIILTLEGKIRRIEVVAFQEPREYIPPQRWYQQFEGKTLEPELQLEKNIHPVTGATLTAQSSTDAARRVLAIDEVLRKRKSIENTK